MHIKFFITILFFTSTHFLIKSQSRERLLINEGWRFYKYTDPTNTDTLIYDVRPPIHEKNDVKDADSKPTESIHINTKQFVLKPWILPTANPFIKEPIKWYKRPNGNPGNNFSFVLCTYDDSKWELIDLPHDWAIKGPFLTGWEAEVGGGMGRLPCNGVGWYRKKIFFSTQDSSKRIFLEIDGAMSYAMVWVNGHLAGGWPYGYASWYIDITPYLHFGKENQLAIRVDNPNHSARWYPGAGIYRNVWLTKVSPIHVPHGGTFIKTLHADKNKAILEIELKIKNASYSKASIEITYEIYEWKKEIKTLNKPIVYLSTNKILIPNDSTIGINRTLEIINPHLWGPHPTQKPNLYVLKVYIIHNKKIIDTFTSRFGIRTLNFDPNKGILINGECIKIKGVNQHHDLGALGAAFNYRAAQRQLEILRDMGCNAIRMAHNPPAPELLELTDEMGFLVINEIFDSWQLKKTPHDFHLIFDEWHEADARAFIRRDRNHPSVIIWSFGNEVGEQYTGEEGANIAKILHQIFKEEDPTRLTTTAMNYAKPYMELPKVPDIIGLNYQGEGIRQDPIFEGTDRIRTAPQYESFHKHFPNKVIISTETASALSSRGVYLFPVTPKNSSFIRDGIGGDSQIMQVSGYELYAVDFGSSPDKVFETLDKHPFVAGEFVWTGWDYLGEPTPYYLARSSYSGIIDLAGFPKDRYFLYQAQWRPDLPMVHIIPHWNWPNRIGQITPVHVFTSGDEAELFLNGKSLGKKKKKTYEYRIRWDSVIYKPGSLHVVAYKMGQKWAEKTIVTTHKPTAIVMKPDRKKIKADGYDLSFITVNIIDTMGNIVPDANNLIQFELDGPGKIVATDNGDPTDMTPFPSHARKTFNGYALVIVKFNKNASEQLILKAYSKGLASASVKIFPEK